MSELRRQVLPIPDRKHVGLTTYVATDPDTSYPPIEPLRPPEGAPNVLVILLDDVGFGASSAFGGPCETPTAERLAADGLKYTRFHTTALCSPTRAALLSGRNHHTVGMGGDHRDRDLGAGLQLAAAQHVRAARRRSCKLNGYSTAQFGKCHEVPVWESSPIGPFDHWPHPGGGFEYFYGFIGGETNQWYPALYEQTDAGRAVGHARGGLPLHGRPDRQGDRWIRQQKSMAPGQAVLHLLRAGRHPRAAPRARRSGSTSTRASSTRAGTRCARRRSRARRSSASSRRCRADRAPARRSRRGTRWTTRSSRCWRARWRSTPASSPTPTTTSVA